MTKLIKVATRSESALVAGAIVGLLRENQQARDPTAAGHGPAQSILTSDLN
ncbi:MAG: hypothetical protein KF893_16920 [Caldilineaceae bacterium]|nr:hypothetical protein [Caldilineaceae bacterium]